MGNTQHRNISHPLIELDRSEGIYSPNDVISGEVLHTKRRKGYLLLNGIVYFEKHKKKQIEMCQIQFFSIKFDLASSSHTKQKFEFRLKDSLPPSFNNPTTFPNIFYSIDLVCKRTKDRIIFSVPIHLCPFIQIDQPLLLKPLLFGPIDNLEYGTKLEIKINRSVFTFDDSIQIFYELQNPKEIFIHQIEVSLGVYYLVESSIYQGDISKSTIPISSIQKLIRNKCLLTIPKQNSLSPTMTYKHNQGEEQSFFNLAIDYKIQFKVYLENIENIWQMDVPIILCNKLIEQTSSSKVEITNDQQPMLHSVTL